MKPWIMALTGIALLLGTGFIAALFMTSRPSYAAGRIFKAMRKGDLPAMRTLLSAELAATLPDGALRAFVARGAHAGFVEARWSDAVIMGERATLRATLASDTEHATPLVLALTRERGEWKLLAAESTTQQLAVTPAPGLHFPPADDLLALLRHSLREFAEAANTGDFATFHRRIARPWAEEYSSVQLASIYRPLWLAYPHIEALADTELQMIRDPEVNEQGMLVIAGRVPKVSPPLAFECGYLWEDGAWKLASLRFSSAQ